MYRYFSVLQLVNNQGLEEGVWITNHGLITNHVTFWSHFTNQVLR